MLNLRTIAFVIFAVLALALQSSFAATLRSGTIIGEVWTPEDSPYLIKGDILVAYLSIQPGTTIQFQDNYVFEVRGLLVAIGTSNQPIVFSRAPGAPGWQSISFRSSDAGSELGFCVVGGALSSGISVSSASPFIHDCIITNNTGGGAGGISLAYSTSIVSNCLVSQNFSTIDAGGMFIGGGAPTILSCTITNNSATNGVGGGINISYPTGHVLVKDCVISGNSSRDSGGGVYVASAEVVDIADCTIFNNRSFSGGGLSGGGNAGTLNIRRTRIAGNIAAPGVLTRDDCYGAGATLGGNCVLEHCLIDNNTCLPRNSAVGYGGGIAEMRSGSVLVFRNTAIIGNTANWGAGIWMKESSWLLTNCIIAQNQGYGVMADGAGVSSFVNCTIANNGEPAFSLSPTHSLTLLNSIIYFNSHNGQQLVGEPFSTTYCDIQGGRLGTGNFDSNPLFQSMSNYVLLPGSPCVDKGKTDSAFNDTCFPPSFGTNRNDLGAYGGPGACGWEGFAWNAGPSILEQPRSRTTCIGQDTILSVRAFGIGELSYQWYYNETNILAGQTGPTLLLANIQRAQAGSYGVRISNPFGQVVSQEALLIVNDACMGINMYAGINVTGIIGRTYVLSSSTNLNSPSAWTAIATNVMTNTTFLYLDLSTPSVPWKSFKVDLLP
jgi:Right handed beta helix region